MFKKCLLANRYTHSETLRQRFELCQKQNERLRNWIINSDRLSAELGMSRTGVDKTKIFKKINRPYKILFYNDLFPDFVYRVEFCNWLLYKLGEGRQRKFIPTFHKNDLENRNTTILTWIPMYLDTAIRKMYDN